MAVVFKLIQARLFLTELLKVDLIICKYIVFLKSVSM